MVGRLHGTAFSFLTLQVVLCILAHMVPLPWAYECSLVDLNWMCSGGEGPWLISIRSSLEHCSCYRLPRHIWRCGEGRPLKIRPDLRRYRRTAEETSSSKWTRLARRSLLGHKQRKQVSIRNLTKPHVISFYIHKKMWQDTPSPCCQDWFSLVSLFLIGAMIELNKSS